MRQAVLPFIVIYQEVLQCFVAKKNGKLRELAILLRLFNRGLVTTTAGTGRPEIEEIQALNLHEAPVDEEVIGAHHDERNEEPCDRFDGYELFLFFHF